MRGRSGTPRQPVSSSGVGHRAGAERQHGEQHRPPDHAHTATLPVNQPSSRCLRPAADAHPPAAASAAACPARGAAPRAPRRPAPHRRGAAAPADRRWRRANSVAMRAFSGSSGLEQPGRADPRRAAQPPGVIHRQAGERDAVEQHAPPRAASPRPPAAPAGCHPARAARPARCPPPPAGRGRGCSMSPSSIRIGVTPASCASAACADRCRHSPCTGTE